MPGIGYNPSIVTDGLVWYFDAASSRCSGTSGTELSASKSAFAWNVAPTINTVGAVTSVTISNTTWMNSTGKRVLPTNSQTPFTFEVWIYPTSGTANQTYLGTANTYTQIGSSGGTIICGKDAGGGGSLVGCGSINMNVWNHIAMTYNGSSANVATVYKNGVIVATPNIGDRTGFINGPHYIGNYSGNGGEPGYGNIAQARVYGKQLSNAEIGQNFSAHRTLFGV